MEMPICCLLMTVTLVSTWMKATDSATLPSPTSWNEPEEEAKSASISPDYSNDTRDYEDEDDSRDRRRTYHKRIIGDSTDKTACTLRAYDADKDLDTIRQWHDLIKAPVPEATAMRELLLESCEDIDKFIMCNTFLFARRERKPCIAGLTNAECLAVTMYSAEVAGGLYREFNNASAYGVWAPYRVFTSLLYSAVKKLAAIEPVPVDAKLYRGMGLRCNPPDAKRIFWKTFTSTTLDAEIAGFFGSSTSLVFEDRATLAGARIKNLSLIDMEEEVLIPPFEIFDFMKADEQTFYFSSSKNQELLLDDSELRREDSYFRREDPDFSHETHDGACAFQVSLLTTTLSIVAVIVSKSPF